MNFLIEYKSFFNNAVFLINKMNGNPLKITVEFWSFSYVRFLARKPFFKREKSI